jgi:uncharacterized repeat protein (TIGR01451 family)
VTFASEATDLVAGQIEGQKSSNDGGNGFFYDVFLYHRPTGQKRLATHAQGSAVTTGNAGNRVEESAVPSGDGRYLAFTGAAADLVDGDLNTRRDVFLMTPFAALTVTNTDGFSSLVPGAPIVYTITVSNSGPGGVSGATVTDAFPSLTGVAWTCTAVGGAVCAASGSEPLAEPVDLPAGGSVTFAASGILDPAATGTLANTASAAVPPEALNLTGAAAATDTDTLTPQAELRLALTATPNPVLAGQALTYTLAVTNVGQSTAAAVTVTHNLPAGAAFVGAAGSGWSCGASAGVVTCTRPALAFGAGPAITVQVTAPLTAGRKASSATVTSTTPDPLPGNNTSNVTITVQ